MKKRSVRLLAAILICAAAAAVAVIGAVYFNFISQRIYEDSTGHLEEIYGQVNRTFGAFVQRNWGLLRDWGDRLARTEDGGGAAAFMEEERSYWGFSQFYLLSLDGSCMTLDGGRGTMALEGVREDLARGGRVMAGETQPDGQEVTVFAAPVDPGEYGGFAYDAVAVSYTNADLAASLKVDAFSGKARCFVIASGGEVLLSTQTGGNVFANYLVYLRAASDLDEEELAKIQRDWESGVSGLLQCRIGGESFCILYQPVGYQGYILLSAVPRSAVSAGFLSVQKITSYGLAAIFLLVGAVVVTLLILRGRSQSRRSRTELEYRELMFDVLSNNVDDIFLMLDKERKRAEYVSPNIERLLGIPLKEARKDIRAMEKCAVDYDVVIPKDELDAIPLGGSMYRECEYMHQTTGERRWYRMTVYRMSIRQVEKFIVVLSDRTLERQMNQKLQEALDAARSANEAKSNFLSNMSHDIRTPMNAIVGFAVLLERDADRPDRVREHARKITASSRHLLSLINDVLDMSKIESGKTSLNVEQFSLPELLEELDIILRPQAKAKDQSFTVRLEGEPPERLMGDKLRLNQILINLLSNAIKYTPEGGHIQFLVEGLPGSAPQYAKLRFTVRDDGIGMSEEFQQHVFAPFSREINSVTNKIQGTGLGMAITKNLVDLMGGIIHVESAPGEGSTFTVELSFALPAQEEPKEAGHGGESALPAAGTGAVMEGRLFLVAEDNELNAEILTELLDMEGARCELASNGREALEMFESAAPGRYDLILMDVQMPVMNGYEATRAIRASGHPEAKTIPIVAMTANTFAEDVKSALDAGMDGHLAKPVDMDTMRELVGRLLKRAPGPDAPHPEEGGDPT